MEMKLREVRSGSVRWMSELALRSQTQGKLRERDTGVGWGREWKK